MPRSAWNLKKPQHAFSLIEVIASVFLVGTLLVAVMTAHRRSAKQLQAAQHHLRAIGVLDELLTQRKEDVDGQLKLPSGKVPGKNAYYWRTYYRTTNLQPDPSQIYLPATVVRIELYDPTYRDGKTQAYVELLESATELSASLNPSS